jgi:hypothetical protein
MRQAVPLRFDETGYPGRQWRIASRGLANKDLPDGTNISTVTIQK